MVRLSTLTVRGAPTTDITEPRTTDLKLIYDGAVHHTAALLAPDVFDAFAFPKLIRPRLKLKLPSAPEVRVGALLAAAAMVPWNRVATIESTATCEELRRRVAHMLNEHRPVMPHFRGRLIAIFRPLRHHLLADWRAVESRQLIDLVGAEVGRAVVLLQRDQDVEHVAVDREVLDAVGRRRAGRAGGMDRAVDAASVACCARRAGAPWRASSSASA